jgi:Cys-rich protein (TIGR01571 family)
MQKQEPQLPVAQTVVDAAVAHELDAIQVSPKLTAAAPARVAVQTTSVLDDDVQSTWTTGLLSCFEHAPTFFEGLCCTRCQSARQFNYLQNGDKGIHWLACGVSGVIDVLTGAPIAGALMVFMNRKQVRTRYNITDGSDFNDCLSAMCCAPCSVCQNDREMAARGEGLHGIFLSTPYQPPMIMRGIQ